MTRLMVMIAVMNRNVMMSLFFHAMVYDHFIGDLKAFSHKKVLWFLSGY